MTPAEISVAECHGTGTALGDPIEVGALQTALNKKRTTPILKTSAKSIHGHLEFGAGISGFVKCLAMVRGCCTPGNCHINYLNPHLGTVGYPVQFTSEMTSLEGMNSGQGGVSSFGATGTNARADVCGRCAIGHRSTGKRSFDAICATPIMRAPLSVGQGKRICIAGTWDAWTSAREMRLARSGFYESDVLLGETLCEQFQLWIAGDRDQALYPFTSCQSLASAAIAGPDGESRGRSWLLDARHLAGSHEGVTAFRIKFKWHASSPTISWDEVVGKAKPINSVPFRHGYALVGTWNKWSCQDMAISTNEPTVFETSLRIGRTGSEEFQVLRDRDSSQTIYPAGMSVTDVLCPVRGPDDAGHGRNWLVQGTPGEIAQIRFRIVDANVSVIASSSHGEKKWEADLGSDTPQYYIAGTFNSWAFDAMEAVDDEPGVYTAAVLLRSIFTEFKIVLDQDWSQRLYPTHAHAASGEGTLQGPDALGERNNWLIKGSLGDTFIVTLNLNLADARKRVTFSNVKDDDDSISASS